MPETFAYQNERLAQLSAAITAADDEIAALESQLAAAMVLPEQVEILHRQNQAKVLRDGFANQQLQLEASHAALTDRFAAKLATAMLNRWSFNVAEGLRTDAVYLKSGGRSLTHEDLLRIGNAKPAKDQDPIDAMVLAGVDRSLAGKLGAVALGRWLQRFPETKGWQPSEIGVLLPLRLETLFETDGNDWTMLLRVIPDEASVLRDSPTVSAAEVEFLTEFWDASKAAYFSFGARSYKWLLHPKGQIAWETLTSRVTPQRAAFLVSTFPAYFNGQVFAASIPPERIGEPERQRLGGLPGELQVCIVDRNKGRLVLGSLKPKPPEDELRVPRGAEDFKNNWLLSWPRAQAIGMGGVFALPPGIDPTSIETLYVAGIGDDDPGDHFRAHVDAGDLALMRLGAPTNTIQGEPAADLDKDAEAWRIIVGRRLSGERGVAILDIGRALCGKEDAFPYLGGDSQDLDDSRLMVATLWPALWGHFHRDIWNRVDDFHALWKWSLDAFHPEGPLVPLRIGAQPYGVLPVTSLRNWQPSGDDFDEIETRIVEQLTRMLPVWQAAAEGRGTVARGGTDNLLRLLGRPGISANYIYRAFSDAEWLATVYGNSSGAFKDVAYKLWAATADLMQQPSAPRAFLATGYAAPLELPLIGSDRLLPDGLTLWDMLQQIYTIDADRFADPFFGQEQERIGVLHRIVPHSLLVRLAMHSVFLVKAWLVESANGTNRPIRNPPSWSDPNDFKDTLLEHGQHGFASIAASGAGQTEIVERARHHDEKIAELFGILDRHLVQGRDPINPDGDPVMQLKLPADREAQLERALRATLDSACHRIDPLATGIAWRKLQTQIDSGHSHHRLGVYGWLDGPFVGQPGPTKAGRLHAPSKTQAITGIVLRDKQLSSEAERATGESNKWAMNMSSSKVRVALAIAQDLRAGFHIFEVIGRQVEEIVGGKTEIEALRKQVPMRRGRADLRDNCNGIEALDRLLGIGIAGVLSGDASVADQQRKKLLALDAALDTYSDLLVAEGVHRVVGGHADLAADAMDAAAGFARPPEFDFVRTPPSGYRLNTSVLAVLPFKEASDNRHALPIELADASLSAFLDSLADSERWVWAVTLPDNSQRNVDLSQIGMRPIETLLLSADTMAEIVRSLTGQPSATVIGPPAHRLVRQLSGLLGSPPKLAELSYAEDVGMPDDDAERQRLQIDLMTRWNDLRDALKRFVDLIDSHEFGEVALRDWLRGAFGWGALPARDGQSPRRLFDVLWGGAEADPDELIGLVAAGKAMLSKRLDHPVPANASLATLAQAISDLLLPGSRLALTVPWKADRLQTVTGLRVQTPDAKIASEWLSVVAAVRPALSRIEAMLLEIEILDSALVKLKAWTNTDDHWQTGLVGKNAKQRGEGVNVSSLVLKRFVAAFGPENAWQSGTVAVSLVDVFSEAVPMAQRSSYAAFGFNAPAARPPQAILLAVPPRADEPLTVDMIVDILEETRQLLRVRAAAPEDLSGLPIVPTAWFDGASAMRVRLDAGSQYWR